MFCRRYWAPVDAWVAVESSLLNSKCHFTFLTTYSRILQDWRSDVRAHCWTWNWKCGVLFESNSWSTPFGTQIVRHPMVNEIITHLRNWHNIFWKRKLNIYKIRNWVEESRLNQQRGEVGEVNRGNINKSSRAVIFISKKTITALDVIFKMKVIADHYHRYKLRKYTFHYSPVCIDPTRLSKRFLIHTK